MNKTELYKIKNQTLRFNGLYYHSFLILKSDTIFINVHVKYKPLSQVYILWQYTLGQSLVFTCIQMYYTVYTISCYMHSPPPPTRFNVVVLQPDIRFLSAQQTGGGGGESAAPFKIVWNYTYVP
jgi:hypothetical protein